MMSMHTSHDPMPLHSHAAGYGHDHAAAMGTSGEEEAAVSAFTEAALRAAASAAFLQPLLVQDEELRSPALELILSDLRVSALGDQVDVREHLLSAVRLSLSAPFDDVRTGFVAFLQFLHKETECSLKAAEASHAVPTRFVDTKLLVPIDTDEEETLELLQHVFLTFGRVSNVHRVLAWHPIYLHAVVDSDSAIMRDDAALPRSWRRYLAVLAAARHHCTPLMQAQAAEFVAEGGDPMWLEGLKHAPARFANLSEFNALVAHRPWLVTTEHIARLVRGENSWSVTELVTALVVLTTFHAQSVFIWGMGVEPDVDLRADTGVLVSSGRSAVAPPPTAAPPVPVVPAPVPAPAPAPIAATSSLGSSSTSTGTGGAGVGGAGGAGAGAGAGAGGGASKRTTAEQVAYEEDLLKGRLMADLEMLMGEAPGDEGDVYEQAGTASISVEATKLSDAGVSHLTGYPLHYSDFSTTAHKVLKTQDYSWEDHGYSLVSRYFPCAAPLLESQFSLTYNLTYSTLSKNTNIDTMPFRRAIWYYVHCIFGIRNDDYNYKEVNLFLLRSVKSFVKKVVCFPETVTKEDFDNFSATLTVDEKCHICLLALEARKQAALLHGLNAIMKYMK